jgi:hypothetical protein
MKGEASMPFPQQTSRPFTQASVEALTPNQIGVYGLFRTDAWVYVGRGDIRARLLSHLNGGNPAITAQRPTHYVTWVTSNDEAMEATLILELSPIANKKVG